MGPLLKEYISSRGKTWSAHLFAMLAHEGQERMGGEPYIFHPEQVAEILLRHGIVDDYLIQAALLHDVVEDTPHTVAEVEEAFGPEVAQVLSWLTDPDRYPGESQNAYYRRIRDRWRHFTANAWKVKMADRLHNLQSMVKSTWEAYSKRRYAKRAWMMLEIVPVDVLPGLQDELYAEAMKWEACQDE